MTIASDPTRHTTDLEQLFSGDRIWVKLCAELLERSIRDHQPVLDRADPTCSGCAHLRRSYEDLLAQSVAVLERSARSESERARLNKEFLRSVRHSHPERARQYETNPRVGRPLTSLSPELLADLAVTWSELTRAEASDAAVARLAATKASANAVVDELADKLRALVAERDQLRELRASMGLDELGLPSMLVDQLAAGSITLHEFLRQAAGAGGSRTFSVDGKKIVVSLGSRAGGPGAAPTTLPPAADLTDVCHPDTIATEPSPTGQAEVALRALVSGSSPAEQESPSPDASNRSASLPSAPTGISQPEPQSVGRPTRLEHPVGTHLSDSPSSPSRQPQPSPQPEQPPAPPRPGRRTVTEDVLRDEAIRTIVCEEAWSEQRFRRELEAIGLDSTPALSSLARARLVKFVHTGSDGFIFPTANFHAASDKIVPSEMTSASARGWNSVFGSLTAEQDRIAFASVLAPFVSSGWNLLFANRARDARVFWLTLRRDDTLDALDQDGAVPRYRSGTIGVLLDPPPYQLPETRRLAEQQVIWLAGKAEHTAGLRGIPSTVDLWRADPIACADADWLAVRSAPGQRLR